MRQKVYIRIGKSESGRNKLAISKKANHQSLENYEGYIPTVQICLMLEIPDNEFEASRINLEANIEETTPCVEVKQIKED